MCVPCCQFGERERRAVDLLIAQALAEDLGEVGDITSTATIPSHARGGARLVARSPGVLAGLPAVERVVAQFELLDYWAPLLSDGASLEPGTVIARVSGPMRSLLAMERIALNFIQRLSGIASLTAKFVAADRSTAPQQFDARKTTPSWRDGNRLEEYAVRCGGGLNHRLGLYDAVLIKDNHLAWLQTAKRAGEPDPIRERQISAAQLPPHHLGTAVEAGVDTPSDFAQPCGSRLPSTIICLGR